MNNAIENDTSIEKRLSALEDRVIQINSDIQDINESCGYFTVFEYCESWGVELTTENLVNVEEYAYEACKGADAVIRRKLVPGVGVVNLYYRNVLREAVLSCCTIIK